MQLHQQCHVQRPHQQQAQQLQQHHHHPHQHHHPQQHAAQQQRCVAAQAVKGGARRVKQAGQRPVHEPLLVCLQPDGSDVWRLEPVIKLLDSGGLGIIPTDSLPAVVCDLTSRDAGLRLYAAMELAPKKQLSILVGGFGDISTYTTGFPIPTQPGQPDWFGLARRLLPGPYTFILPASKNLPSQVIDFKKGRTQKRKSVGVRYPDSPVAQAVLSGLGRCLLSHSVHLPNVDMSDDEYQVPDTGSLLDLYGNKGLDFIVDVGQRRARPTSVIDMTGVEPEVVRAGKGDVSMFGE